MTLPVIADQKLLVEVQTCCTALTGAFAQLVDTGRYDELVRLFTPDCEFERPGAHLRGREELLTFMKARPADIRSRHVCTPTMLESATADAASGRTLLCFYDAEASDEGPATLKGLTAIAEYRDDFVRTAEGWRIAHRRVVPMIAAR